MCAFVFMVDWSTLIEFWPEPTHSKIQANTWKLERMKSQVNRDVIVEILPDEGTGKTVNLIDS
jgi:hypothetical protein